MRQNQFDIELSVDGVNIGTFDTFEGGESDSEDTVYRPGKMAKAISLGGHATVSAITITRLYQIDRDPGIVHFLRERNGKGQCTVVKQPLDVDGNAGFFRPEVFTGILKTVKSPEHDSESDDAAKLELQVTPNGSVS